MFTLTSDKIDREALIDILRNDKAGALVVFEGWVRDHNEGKKVSSLEYQVYEALARKEGEKIVHEAKDKFNLHDIVCSHRFGHLHLGDAAVWVGATATHRDDAFKASRYVIDEIKLRLPIWKKEHYVSEEPKWVFCKDHHTHVHFHEEDFYKKQNKLVSQDNLKKAHVLVVGAGGLGCPALTSLTAAGVGHIDIVEFDKVSISNIHRQTLYAPEVVGEKKVTIAKNKLSTINPFIHVHGHDAKIGTDNVERFVSGKTLVLDCTDNLETKFLLHDACMKLRVAFISASIYQFEGQVRTFIPGETGCLRCTHKTTPDDSKLGNCNDFGVLGSSVAVIGNIQANEALLYLSEGKNNSSTETFFMNLKILSQMKIKNLKRPDCEVCEGKVEIIQNDLEIDVAALHTMDAVLVDVRDNHDLSSYEKSQKPVVLYCHRGITSKRLVQEMRLKGYPKFYSLKGGACSL
jgi:molybdopterin/thiamine biosynthesis adenylyltransferase/molybdopterin synthase catalytic subunit/rhodanese-related sulfurtransferase